MVCGVPRTGWAGFARGARQRSKMTRDCRKKTIATMKILIALIDVWFAAFVGQQTAATRTKEHPCRRIGGEGWAVCLLVDGAPFLMLGAQSNNSSDWPGTLDKVCRRLSICMRTRWRRRFTGNSLSRTRVSRLFASDLIWRRRGAHATWCCCGLGLERTASQHYMGVDEAKRRLKRM